MRPALYLMKFAAVADFGGGVVYIGDRKVVGMDVGNVRYKGTYSESAGHIDLTVRMSAPTGATLVTGQQLPAGSSLNLTARWPTNFAGGQELPLLVEGRPVHVTFE